MEDLLPPRLELMDDVSITTKCSLGVIPVARHMVPGRRDPLLISLLLLAPLLSGCLGFGGSEGNARPSSNTKARAETSASTGGIQGVVTDAAIQPIQDAKVTLVEAGRTTRTATDGSFAFSKLSPGSYSLEVNASGFHASRQSVTVEADRVSTVDFVLQHTRSTDAFTQTIEFTAFMECAVGAGVNGTGTPLGHPQVTWTTCDDLNSLPGGNATNDDTQETISLEAPINTLVWEARWDASGNALGENMWFVSEIQGFDGFIADNETVHETVNAASPWKVAIEKERFEKISDWFTKQCQAGEDSYCGHNFWENGWPLVVQTFTATDCTGTPVHACGPLQVEINHVFTAFYNAPAPEGYSVFEGGS